MTYLGTSALNLLNVCCGAINLEGTADVETGPIEEVRILQHHWKWALNRGQNKKVDPPTDQIHFLRQWREHGGPTQVTPLGDTYVYVWYVCLFLQYTFLIENQQILLKQRNVKIDLNNLTKDQNYVV